jgi:hypothetical protein
VSFKQRIKIIREIEKLRNSTVICYLTSVRQGVNVQMAEDAVRVFFDHLLLLPKKPIKRLDIFLCSNGGSGTVPWRLVSLFREYADHLGVLLPYRAYSAATMVALGADEIVMHPFAEMGPIDPTVTSDYNPIDPQTHQKIGISVEDVKAYVSFVKNTVGIQHEDELVRTIEILAQKVHPLALGNVERFISQSRLIARKILLTHMSDETAKHKVDEIIETLASKLYFHGHPINRREARTELGLKVAEAPDPKLEAAMWKLYLDFEEDLKNQEVFDPMSELWKNVPAIPPLAPPGGVAPVPTVPIGTASEMEINSAYVECGALSSKHSVRRRFVVVGQGATYEPIIRQEVLAQGWDHQSAPTPAPKK